MITESPYRTPQAAIELRETAADKLIYLPLCQRQEQILRVIYGFLDAKGFPPTIREIQQETGIANPGIVFSALEGLRRKGYIERKKRKHRGLRPTVLGEAVWNGLRPGGQGKRPALLNTEPDPRGIYGEADSKEELMKGAPEKMILIADDDTNLREMIRLVLEDAGYRVLEAVDGRDTVEMAEHHRPDLVLLDIMMPEKHGFQVCHELRRAEPLKNTKVLMYSVKSFPADRRLALEVGADGFLCKSVSTKVVVSNIRELLCA